MIPGNWVYVTGAPRSGTTFVGTILSTPWSVDYIHEPFNPDCGMPGIERRFLYLRPSEPAPVVYDEAIQSLFSYRLRLRTGIYAEDPPWKRIVKGIVGSRGPFHLRFAKHNAFRKAIVVKDPIGCMLTEHLASRAPIRPVILIRHPVAFVASMLRLGWAADLEALTSQPALVEDFFARERGRFEVPPDDPVSVSAVLWWALNRVLLRQAARHPGWIVVTHERISADPLTELRRLFRDLGLPWSSRVERRIRKRTARSNSAEARRGHTQDFSRDSRSLFEHRARSLSVGARRTVFELTADVARDLYEVKSFGLDGDPTLVQRGQ